MEAAVLAGDSFLLIEVISTVAECAALALEAAAAAARERESRGLGGLVRQPVQSLVGKESSALCDDLLMRQLATLHSLAPSLEMDLFGDALSTSPSTCMHNPRLAWSEGEPAINVYTPGGCFTPHEDEQSLTCLVNLSPPHAYTGGGAPRPAASAHNRQRPAQRAQSRGLPRAANARRRAPLARASLARHG